MIFVERSDGALVTFEGMAPDVITQNLSLMGLTGIFLTEAEYKNALASILIEKPVPVIVPTSPFLTDQTASIDLRFDALIDTLKSKGIL